MCEIDFLNGGLPNWNPVKNPLIWNSVALIKIAFCKVFAVHLIVLVCNLCILNIYGHDRAHKAMFSGIYNGDRRVKSTSVVALVARTKNLSRWQVTNNVWHEATNMIFFPCKVSTNISNKRLTFDLPAGTLALSRYVCMHGRTLSHTKYVLTCLKPFLLLMTPWSSYHTFSIKELS